MNTNLTNTPESLIAAGLSTELVRGEEQRFLDRLLPLVRRGPVALDLGYVERIDAAGIAALITLYCDACKAGTRFTITNASARVREILALVRLDVFLIEQESLNEARCGEAMARSAA